MAPQLVVYERDCRCEAYAVSVNGHPVPLYGAHRIQTDGHRPWCYSCLRPWRRQVEAVPVYVFGQHSRQDWTKESTFPFAPLLGATVPADQAARAAALSAALADANDSNMKLLARVGAAE